MVSNSQFTSVGELVHVAALSQPFGRCSVRVVAIAYAPIGCISTRSIQPRPTATPTQNYWSNHVCKVRSSAYGQKHEHANSLSKQLKGKFELPDMYLDVTWTGNISCCTRTAAQRDEKQCRFSYAPQRFNACAKPNSLKNDQKTF